MKAPRAETEELRVDESLRRQGYCGAIDGSTWLRCYRRPGHSGACNFTECFQLRHPRLGPKVDRRR